MTHAGVTGFLTGSYFATCVISYLCDVPVNLPDLLVPLIVVLVLVFLNIGKGE